MYQCYGQRQRLSGSFRCVYIYIYTCSHVVVAGDAMDCLHVVKFEDSLEIEIKNSYTWPQLLAAIAFPIYSMYIYIYICLDM